MPSTDANNRVLELLSQHGDMLTEVCEIEHFAYFPTRELRAGFIEKCLTSGFKLRRTTEPYKSGTGFGAILFHNDIPDEELLEVVTTLLSQLADDFGGEYDGWETQLV